MRTAIEMIQNALDGSQHNEDERGELRRALEILKRSENATSDQERPDFRDPNFKQIANQPDSGEELANEKGRRNRLEGDLAETVRPPDKGVATPPPVEAGPKSKKQ